MTKDSRWSGLANFRTKMRFEINISAGCRPAQENDLQMKDRKYWQDAAYRECGIVLEQ